MRWCGHARHAAVTTGKDFFDSRQRDFPLADLHQGAHDPAAHLVEKAVAFDDEGDLRAGLPEVAARQRAHVGFHFVAACSGEAAEIVFADK